MWERFTERARQAVYAAKREAKAKGHEFVSTEHLLLGLLNGECVAVRVLRQIDADPDRVRAEVEGRMAHGDPNEAMGEALAPRAKLTIDLAYLEASDLNNDYVGTEHLLLGLLREGDGLAGRVLAKLGVELERARRQVRALQTVDRLPADLYDEDARIALAAARAIARTSGAAFVTTENLLIGLLSKEGRGMWVLQAMGVGPARLLKEVRERPRVESVSERDVDFSFHARLALDLAEPEMTGLGHRTIGTDHLLLGLVREGAGVAGRALAQLGVDIDNARLAAEAVRAQEYERNPKPPPEVKKATMWQRFTERARKVVFYAQEEAQKFGEGYVSTEHLLLGLVRESDSVAARVLEKLGVSLNRVRVEVEKQLPRGDARPSQDMTLTPRAKRVIDLAYDEARNLNNNYIGTEHLLLGLIREGDGLAGRVLQKLGVELERARREVLALQDREGGGQPGAAGSRPPTPPPDPWARFEDAARAAFVAAETEALTRGQSFRSPEHLLLGLLEDRENPACRALAGLGVDLDRLREAVEARCRTAPAREGEAPLSPAATQAFTLAYKEQAMLDARRTGTEHLLLGLLREPDGVAGRVLEEFGVGLVVLREAVRTLPGKAKGDGEARDEGSLE